MNNVGFNRALSAEAALWTQKSAPFFFFAPQLDLPASGSAGLRDRIFPTDPRHAEGAARRMRRWCARCTHHFTPSRNPSAQEEETPEERDDANTVCTTHVYVLMQKHTGINLHYHFSLKRTAAVYFLNLLTQSIQRPFFSVFALCTPKTVQFSFESADKDWHAHGITDYGTLKNK